MPVELYLRLQGIAEITVGLFFLAWFFNHWGILLGTLYAIAEFSFILIFKGVDLITFRDIGLLGAACALLILMVSSRNAERAQPDRAP